MSVEQSIELSEPRAITSAQGQEAVLNMSTSSTARRWPCAIDCGAGGRQ